MGNKSPKKFKQQPESSAPSLPNSFNCPFCEAYAHHYRGPIYWLRTYGEKPQTSEIKSIPTAEDMTHISEFQLRKCSSCGMFSIWIGRELVYPKQKNGPEAHENMPDDVKRDYSEARLVIDDSPRAAAALLRLAIQRLVENHLDTEQGSLYQRIGNLVESGRISPRIQKALDSVRVVGNNSVHPGEMNMDDDRDTAIALLKLVNAIIEETIGRDEMIDEIYSLLPDNKKEGIKQRDRT